jgi:heme A synthase
MLSKVTIGLFFVLLVWGNIVAGLKAGLACPDWPLCHGKVVPPFRWDIYVEFSHRVLGGVAGIFLVILAVKRLKTYSSAYKSVPIIAIVLLAIQVVMGGLVVLLKLPINLTTIHFLTALVIFSLVLFLAYFDGLKNKPAFRSKAFSNLFFFLSILVFVQAVLGAYVRHSGAGLACPDFPKCLGFWIPPELSGVVLIHFLHRSLAYIIFAVFTILLIYSRTSQKLQKYKKKIGVLFGLIVFQILLGMGIIHSRLFFAITAIHIFVALLILYIIINAWYSENRQRTV